MTIRTESLYMLTRNKLADREDGLSMLFVDMATALEVCKVLFRRTIASSISSRCIYILMCLMTGFCENYNMFMFCSLPSV